MHTITARNYDMSSECDASRLPYDDSDTCSDGSDTSDDVATQRTSIHMISLQICLERKGNSCQRQKPQLLLLLRRVVQVNEVLDVVILLIIHVWSFFQF